MDEKISDSFIIIARDNFSRKHCLYISMFQHINAFLPISWECPAYLKLVCIKYVCTLTSHSRFTYTSQFAGRLFSFQKVFLVPFTKVDSVVSNCSLKRLRQSTTIYLFLFAFISITPFCFSLPKSIVPQHFVVSAAHRLWFCSKEWFVCNYRDQDQHIGK